MTSAKQKAAANVDRLLLELRIALVECGEGPLRAVVDSDGNSVVQSLVGRPVSNGHRIIGVHPIMFRAIVGPELPAKPIKVEATR